MDKFKKILKRAFADSEEFQQALTEFKTNGLEYYTITGLYPITMLIEMAWVVFKTVLEGTEMHAPYVMRCECDYYYGGKVGIISIESLFYDNLDKCQLKLSGSVRLQFAIESFNNLKYDDVFYTHYSNQINIDEFERMMAYFNIFNEVLLDIIKEAKPDLNICNRDECMKELLKLRDLLGVHND